VLCVSARQEGRGSCKEFEQKFTIPSGVNIEKLSSSLSKGGVLTISAPREPLCISSSASDGHKELPAAITDQCSSALTQPSLVYDDDRLTIEIDVKEPQQNNLPVSPYNFDNGVSRVECDEDNYRILVDVHQFSPEDLVIKTVDDAVIVEASHEEKTVDGRSYSNKSFSQSFNLPRGLNPERVTSALSKEGVLTITAPLNKSLQ